MYLDLENMVRIIQRLGLKIATVYIGGGTPTVLNPEQLRSLLEKINGLIDVSSLMEFTMESGRPDTITEEKMHIAREYGVTRVSVNPQTLSDDVLREVGRQHTVDDFYRAYEIARNSGIRDINVDLIAGLPGDTFANFSKSMDGIIDLDPTNLTVHTFCVKKSADILKSNKDIYSQDSRDATKSVAYSQLKARFAGYHPYYLYRQRNTVGNLENVGYAKDGHDGMYNIFMMEELHSIFAVGAGAVTKLVARHTLDTPDAIIRIFTPKYPYEYLRDADAIRMGDSATGKESIEERIVSFYKEHGLYSE
jgi:oxygen-independent coproporphyrinogen-3 oxidase